MASSTYSFTWNKATLGALNDAVVARMKGLAFKTLNEAKKGAPVLTGVLQNSIRVADADRTTEVIAAGGSMAGASVLYARRREYENRAHPETKYYMRNAFTWLKNNYKNEFKGLI